MDDGNIDNITESTGMQGKRGRLIQTTISQYMSTSMSTDDQDIVGDIFTQEEAFENHLSQHSNEKLNFRSSDYSSSLPTINIRDAENLFLPINPNHSSARPSSTSRTILAPIDINDPDILLSNNTENSKIRLINNEGNQAETNTNKTIKPNTVSQNGKERIIVASENGSVKYDNQEGKTIISSGKRRFINNASFTSSSVSESCSNCKYKPQSYQKFPRQPFEIFCASQVTPYLMRHNSVKNLRRFLNSLGYYQHFIEKACTFDRFLEATGERQVQDYLNQVDSNRIFYKCSDCDFKSDLYIVLLQHRDKFKHYTQ